MARSETDILGLPVVSLADARILAEVDELIIDDSDFSVAGFLVDMGLYEASVIPFSAVRAIGTDAVIVADDESLSPISSEPALAEIAERGVGISGHRALTVTGREVGSIGDFFIDTATGRVLGMEFIPEDMETYPENPQIIPVASVRSVGPNLVVLEPDYAKYFLPDPDALTGPPPLPAVVEPPELPAIIPPTRRRAPKTPRVPESGAPPVEGRRRGAQPSAPGAPMPTQKPAAEKPETPLAPDSAQGQGTAQSETQAPSKPRRRRPSPAEPASAAPESPTVAEPAVPEAPTPPSAETPVRHFLLGKRVLRRIEDANGQVIADRGDTVTPEIIQRAKDADQLLILSLNVES